MKFNKGGNEIVLLWPKLVPATDSENTAAYPSSDSSRPSPDSSCPAQEESNTATKSGLTTLADLPHPDLLWPAALINLQARNRQQRSYLLPLAASAFVISALIALALGPLELGMLMANSDAGYTSQIVHNLALKIILPLTSLIALFDFALIIQLFCHPNIKHRVITASIAASLIEIAVIWIFGFLQNLLPHHFLLVALGVSMVLVLILFFINSQYVATANLALWLKITLGALAVIALVEAILGGVYLVSHLTAPNNLEVDRVEAAQVEARVEGVPPTLSNLVFTLCDGKYQVVHLSQSTQAGLFECSDNGEVYSVSELTPASDNPTSGLATYLGTTKDKTITTAFSNSYYLYRSLPQVLSEDELVLMFPASSEQELIDSFTPMLLAYWQNHNDHNLFLNVFYNQNLTQITGTRDYILGSAMSTMVMAEGLPHGLTRTGVSNGKTVEYHYRADTELTALNELGADPSLYAVSTREALTTHRHIALHLTAGETFDQATLQNRLWESFVGGAE